MLQILGLKGWCSSCWWVKLSWKLPFSYRVITIIFLSSVHDWAPKDFATKSAIFYLSKNANFIKNFAKNLKCCHFSPSKNFL